MSLEKIVNKIMTEATDTAKVITERAEGELKKLDTELKVEESELKGSAEKAARSDAAEIIRRKASSARLEGRKRVLGEKEMILGEVFAEAKERLLSLPDDKYLELLKGFVLKYASSGDETIMLSATDQKRLKGKLSAWEKELNGGLKDKGISGSLKVSDETRDIVGGLVLSKGRTEINLSLDVLLSEMRLVLEGELTEILFGGAKGK